MTFTLVGCGKDETLFKIDNYEFHFDKETTYKDIKYTVSNDFREINQDLYAHYMQYSYAKEDESNLFFFRIFYYENKDTNYVLNDLGLDKSIQLTDGKTDNFEYKFYKTPTTDGGTINYYFATYNKNTYVISYISKYDISDFEQRSMKLISFVDNKEN